MQLSNLNYFQLFAQLLDCATQTWEGSGADLWPKCGTGWTKLQGPEFWVCFFTF